MHIKLVVVAAPDGGVVGPSVDVHCMGQGVIATSSLHHLQRSAACEEQYRSSMRTNHTPVQPANNLPVANTTSNNALRQHAHSLRSYYHIIFHNCLLEVARQQ